MPDIRLDNPVAALPIVYESAVSVLHKYGWWNGEAPNLFQATDGQVQQIVTILVEILSHVAKHPIPQPYSLLTKWLHFCLPKTFAIWDSQAAESIQKCSDLIHGHLGPKSAVRRQFRLTSIYTPGGSGYKGILNFYLLCRDAAVGAGLMEALLEASQRLEAIQHQAPGCSNTQVSLLDILDKHLWRAKGDLHILGIA